MNVGNLETRGREKGSTSSSYCRFQAIPIAWVLGVLHTPKALVCRAKTAVSSGCESHPAKGRCSRKQSERGEEVTTFAETLR